MTVHLDDEQLVAIALSGGDHPHLGACARCQGELRRWKADLLVMRDGDPTTDPRFDDAWFEALAGRIDAAVARSDTPARRTAPPGVWLRLAAAVLVMAGLVAATWSLRPPRSDGPGRAAPPLAATSAGPVAVATPAAGSRQDLHAAAVAERLWLAAQADGLDDPDALPWSTTLLDDLDALSPDQARALLPL